MIAVIFNRKKKQKSSKLATFLESFNLSYECCSNRKRKKRKVAKVSIHRFAVGGIELSPREPTKTEPVPLVVPYYYW